jgi:hypothetical protein
MPCADTSRFTNHQLTAYRNGVAEAMDGGPQLIPHGFNEASLAEAWTIGYDDGVQELKRQKEWEQASSQRHGRNPVTGSSYPIRLLPAFGPWCWHGFHSWCPRGDHLVVVRELGFIHGGGHGGGGLVVVVLAITAVALVWAIGSRK